MPAPTLGDLRRYAVGRSLFAPTTLSAALRKLGFVQADPIRAPARAQDLTLRHRVRGYRAGDLERRYPELDVEEDVFVNYGFVSREIHELMHPRGPDEPWPASARQRSDAILGFIRERGEVHPREVDALFAHGRATNYWGGLSKATTHLLGEMHYRGLVRVTRREGGIRIYAPREPARRVEGERTRRERLDRLVDVLVGKYAPLPAHSLAFVLGRLRYATPQWAADVKAAIQRARERLGHARVDGVSWYWPAGERPTSSRYAHRTDVRLLAPFDPVVWDRRRFEILWGWPYRFEAYTPARQRKRGYYALPLLWRDEVVGWANVAVRDGRVSCDCGYASGRPPRDPAFRDALREDLDRMRVFLGLSEEQGSRRGRP
jgi:uncharacterized protein YcaQ